MKIYTKSTFLRKHTIIIDSLFVDCQALDFLWPPSPTKEIWKVLYLGCCLWLYTEILKTRTSKFKTRPPVSREETDDTDNKDDTVDTVDTDDTDDKDDTDDIDDSDYTVDTDYSDDTDDTDKTDDT